MRGRPAEITIELQPLMLRADLASVNDEARTVELIFSTGAGVERFDWNTGKRFIERLSLEPSAVDLGRLNSGAPLLDSHSAWSIADQIGAVVPNSARIEKGKALATVRFSKREAVESIWQDVKDGIVRNVSVGYRVHRFEEEEGTGNKLPVRTATKWQPYEISMVAMGADAGAKVRADRSQMNTCVITSTRSDADRVRRFDCARAGA